MKQLNDQRSVGLVYPAAPLSGKNRTEQNFTRNCVETQLILTLSLIRAIVLILL